MRWIAQLIELVKLRIKGVRGDSSPKNSRIYLAFNLN
jgi:hypothetical protein